MFDPSLKPSGGHSQDALKPAWIDMLFSMQMRCVSFAEKLAPSCSSQRSLHSLIMFVPITTRSFALLGCTHCLGVPVQEPANNYRNQLLPQGIQLQHQRIQEMAHPRLQHQPHAITPPQDVLHSHSNASCKMILILK